MKYFTNILLFCLVIPTVTYAAVDLSGFKKNMWIGVGKYALVAFIIIVASLIFRKIEKKIKKK
jgi:hypothetical protein